jgi:penicillin-binding protein 1A
MAEALRDRPVLEFTPPPGVTLAQWNGEEGPVTDAFKPGQEPGASAPLDAPQLVSEPTESAPATAEASEANPGNAASPHPAAGSNGAGGLDAGLGGLY